tara:strand:+ start:896 stop:2248 length:1353 start_codon:yes stop_codon:yes gene_type:complete
VVDQLQLLHEKINALVWGGPMLLLLIGTGLLLSVATKGVQFVRFGFAIREVLGKIFADNIGEGTVRPFHALATSLASTVGVGNIAGVATAISLGGPGALFWMLFSGVVGMATKFSEITLALRFRERDDQGIMRGGAMYILAKNLNCRWLGVIFAALVALAAFGIGNMVQANSVAIAAQNTFGSPSWLTGLVLCVVTALVVLGGLRRIVEVASILVPAMCLLYLLGGITILALHINHIPAAIMLVIRSAFAGQSTVGGFVGVGITQSIRFGVARGLFSNEAGLGSAPIVHSSAVTDHPVRQGCYGIFDVFIDTLVVGFVTGMVILTTGVWESGSTGTALAYMAFQEGLPGEWGGLIVNIGLILFAFSSIIGWAYYGETGAMYLLGTKVLLPYRLLWVGFVYLGATGSLQLIWNLADTMNGLMAFPNLLAILGSLGILQKLTSNFFGRNRLT